MDCDKFYGKITAEIICIDTRDGRGICLVILIFLTMSAKFR